MGTTRLCICGVVAIGRQAPLPNPWWEVKRAMVVGCASLSRSSTVHFFWATHASGSLTSG